MFRNSFYFTLTTNQTILDLTNPRKENNINLLTIRRGYCELYYSCVDCLQSCCWLVFQNVKDTSQKLASQILRYYKTQKKTEKREKRFD